MPRPILRKLPPLLLLAGCLAVATAAALEIEETRWGFDGKICPRVFTMLNVLISNPTAETFEGAITLTRTDIGGEQRGARLVRLCVLAPYGSRWLQFRPRTPGQLYQKWKLTWGRGGVFDVPQPTLGPPATVYLTAPAALHSGRIAFRRFDEGLFPTEPGSTAGLSAVILDHAPRWERARRDCFLDWIRLGGIVHLCRGPDDRLPAFGPGLAALNTDSLRTRLGAGWILRHDLPANQLTPSHLAALGFPPPKLEANPQNAFVAEFDNTMLRRLGSCVPIAHNWTLLLWLNGLYILLAFPVNYLLGRRHRHARVPLAFLAVLIPSFSLLFMVIGRRGYGENAMVFTLSLARSTTPGHYSTTQWSNAFLTRGNTYKITHSAPSNLYATCQNMEAVNAIIQNGRNGSLIAEIPLFSKRSFVHYGVMTGPDLTPEIQCWQPENNRVELCLPQALPGLEQAWLFLGDRFYPLNGRDKRILRTTAAPLPTAKFLNAQVMLNNLGRAMPYYHRRAQKTDTVEQTRKNMTALAKPLISCSLGGASALQNRIVDQKRRDLNSACLFLVAKSPESFNLQSSRPMGRETGYTLYRIPVIAPQPTEAGL